MRRVAIVLAVAVVFLLPALAGGDAATTDEDYVFTNDDLEERYGAPDSSPGQSAVAPVSDEEWKFVQDYLARSYSRIDTDRQYEIDRELADARVRELDRRNSRPRYVAPYVGLYGGWAVPYRYPPVDPDYPEVEPYPGGETGQRKGPGRGTRYVGGADGVGGSPSGGWHASPPKIKVGTGRFAGGIDAYRRSSSGGGGGKKVGRPGGGGGHRGGGGRRK